MDVTIERLNNTTFKVTVRARATTTHTVTVRPEYWQKLTGGRVPQEQLVQESFEFLLDREPNTSILAEFDLSVIQRYFPEYERALPRLLE